ncbi:phosphatidylserine/phosphatidylglycerophosphate/cardiolipin synthase [Shewanella psychrophila]|uniref:Phosphatidylserine/phosphatidylglycerophosphate/ cardiolipin synthase n=1 Tax=Shewanella psychrophila TaxID=225848 RepID=A0A1S6HT84_9GAMM|nr:phospholipase D-like domain-containing protein [Shewanella psychrophila]AQS38760.1 phosphatidylserine/phosphatidylglycerophosphate/cardiolipin synthase [Shewanella psychrophila]
MAKNKLYLRLVSVLFFLLSACSSVPELADKKTSYRLLPADDSPLAIHVGPQVSEHPEQTGAIPLINGLDAFIARLALIKSANTSIDLQYYIYRNDDAGKLLIWHVLDAAERGVRIRILLDDLTSKNLDQGLLNLASHRNIDVRLFNPSFFRRFRGLEFITGFSRMNRRMHNKSLTVDNSATIVGGRNIGNEYFSNNEDVDFGDFDLMVIGEAVEKVSTQFDRYWNADTSFPIASLTNNVTAADDELERLGSLLELEREAFESNQYVGRLKLSQLLQQIQENRLIWHWGKSEVVYDPPEKAKNQLQQEWLLSDLSRFLSGAQKEVLIVSPYFVPTKAGTRSLVQSANAGLDITIITNSLAATDVLAVHAGYQGYRQPLLKAGIKIYEVKVDPLNKPSSWSGSSRSSLHAKTFVLDRKSIFVGSFNFDPRSAHINTEMGIMFHNAIFANAVVVGVEEGLADSTYQLALEGGELIWIDEEKNRVIYAEPDAGFWRKFMADLIALFPLESQL